MNYLAHAYLSFNQEEILVGNMISDFVKGKKKYEYSPGIQEGITLHRAIDTFTDSHEATREAKQFLKPELGLYAGAFTDIVYDHFLAIDTNEFNAANSLESFTATTYMQLEKHFTFFPERFRLMFPHMQKHNWLYNYQFNWGIEKSFGGLVRRAAYLSDAGPAFKLFEENYDALKDCYAFFFPQLKEFAKGHLKL